MLRSTRTSSRGWRHVAAVIVASSFALAAVSCGSDTGSDSSSDGAVVIEHKRGEAKVEGVPTRIVAIGNQWLDSVQALGITPVGYIDNIAIVSGGKKVPWEPESLQKATALKPGGEMVEQIAQLSPDLILAPGFLVDQPTYDKLSSLAPTITDLSDVEVDPWDKQVTALGKVLHKESEAEKVIAGVGEKIDAVAKKYPGLKGKSFLTCFLAGPTQLMVLADAKDGSSEMFVKLGMTVPEKLAQEANGARLALSPERLGELTADLVVATGAPEPYQALPGYAELPSVQHGGIVFFSLVEISGLNQPTPLSVPYMLDKLDPTLANVAK
jgi:iron complex transport system substrate-binding protein